ncbi:MAG: 5'-nucleotidase C-terminal domain-containing protein [Bacteroidales bacterium]|nr:5'-nucleotidase C-terminal domain-containing protein [Bacteroidales bacterium]
MKRFLIVALAVALALVSCRPKGYSQYSWEYHELTDRYDAPDGNPVQEAIAKYDSLLAPLQEIVCYSNAVYAKEKPESGLSNYSVDAVRNFAEKYTGEQIDIALLNFGGIRTELPKGAVRVYDVFSIFPFNNYLNILEVDGRTVEAILHRMARKNKIEPLSGVRMKIDGDRLVECTVGGSKLDFRRNYKIATIDFLVTGGDGIDWGDGILERRDTGILLRDVIISEMKDAMAAGKTLDLKSDGRVVITNPIKK